MVQVNAEWAEHLGGKFGDYVIECPECGKRVYWEPSAMYQNLTCDCTTWDKKPRRWDFYVAAESYQVKNDHRPGS